MREGVCVCLFKRVRRKTQPKVEKIKLAVKKT